MSFSFVEIGSAFIVLFAIIDILGSVPIILGLQQKGEQVFPLRTCGVALGIMILFLFAGDMVLRLFNVDEQSFAVAGSLVLFIMALEMILDVEIMKNNGPKGASAIVPIAFPLVAGPGSLTALLSLRAEYSILNIIIALLLNFIWVFVVLKSSDKVKRIVGDGGIYIMRKFFGIILLAMSVKLFTSNITHLIESIHKC